LICTFDPPVSLAEQGDYRLFASDIAFSPDNRLLFTVWGGADVAVYGMPGE